MRQFFATGSIRLTSIAGRNIRPNCLKRGAKSVIRTPPPSESVSVVRRIGVLPTYACSLLTRFSTSTSMNPPWSLSSKAQKIGSLSSRGWQSQTYRPCRSISAATTQLPTAARSSVCIERTLMRRSQRGCGPGQEFPDRVRVRYTPGGEALFGCADTDGVTAGGLDRGEPVLVCRVVADEHRHPPGERRGLHQVLDRLSLADPGGLQLEDPP